MRISNTLLQYVKIYIHTHTRQIPYKIRPHYKKLIHYNFTYNYYQTKFTIPSPTKTSINRKMTKTKKTTTRNNTRKRNIDVDTTIHSNKDKHTIVSEVNDNDNGKENERTTCATSKNNTMTTDGEQVRHSNNTTTIGRKIHDNNTTSPNEQIIHHTADNTNENEILNNDDVGCTNQRKHMETTADIISVSNKTGSMSSLSHEKAEIAVMIPQLFQLKKFICSDNELTYTGKIAQFFYKELSIRESEREEWWLAAVSKVRKSIDNKRACVSMAIKTEFMRKYRIRMIPNSNMFYSPNHIKIV